MRIIVLAFVTAIVIAGAAAGLLESKYQSTAYDAFATVGTRVGEAGHNLVGKDWPAKAN
jgi:hypothetical protein